MKAALIAMVCAALVSACEQSTPTTFITITNTSEIKRATDVELIIDKAVIFKGAVQDIPTKLRTQLSRGEHFITFKMDSAKSISNHNHTVKGTTRIDIEFKVMYQLDPKTNQPVPGGWSSRGASVMIGRSNYPTKDETAYVEILTAEKQ